MNTWRDIKTAPKHQPVLVTVEGMICFGRFCDFEDEDYSGLAFDGACLSDGESVSYFADYIDGWKPAPATFQPEKTADEMFRELGYKKAEENKDYIAYLKKDNWRTEIRFYRMTKRVKKSLYSHWGTFIGPEYLFFNEMLACAQLIKEMEDPDNG